jgi:hypothetical protein
MGQIFRPFAPDCSFERTGFSLACGGERAALRGAPGVETRVRGEIGSPIPGENELLSGVVSSYYDEMREITGKVGRKFFGVCCGCDETAAIVGGMSAIRKN